MSFYLHLLDFEKKTALDVYLKDSIESIKRLLNLKI